MEGMKSRGIQTSIHYPPIHHFSAYRELTARLAPDLGLTEAVAAREVTLPLYPALSETDVTMVVEAVRDSLAGECQA
jgi:dTDP-4-amino-4,6-dideoxygalactose transaminase